VRVPTVNTNGRDSKIDLDYRFMVPAGGQPKSHSHFYRLKIVDLDLFPSALPMGGGSPSVMTTRQWHETVEHRDAGGVFEEAASRGPHDQ